MEWSQKYWNAVNSKISFMDNPPKALHSACPIQESNITIIINNQTVAPRRQLSDAKKAEKIRSKERKERKKLQRLEKNVNKTIEPGNNMQVRLDVEAQRRKESRAQEPDEIQQARLQNQALRQQALREEEKTADERRVRMIEDNLRHQVRRDQETEDGRASCIMVDAMRHQVLRAQETVEENTLRAMADRLRHQMYLVEETEEEAEIRWELKREKTANYRGAENEEETLERVEENRLRLERLREEQAEDEEIILAMNALKHAEIVPLETEEERTNHEEILAARNQAGLPRTYRLACKTKIIVHYMIVEQWTSFAKNAAQNTSRECPQPLAKLLQNNHPKSKSFMAKTRTYNSAHAFTSFGASISSPPGRGVYCFRIHGQVYHNTTPVGLNTTNPKYANLYFMDAAQASEFRADFDSNGRCCRNLMAELDAMLREKNPYAAIFKMMRQVLEEEYRRAEAENLPHQIVGMIISSDRRNLDQRRYNSPTTNEIAVLFPSANGEPPAKRDIQVHLFIPVRGRTFIKISTRQPMCDPMTYPFLFPNGDDGWLNERLLMQIRAAEAAANDAFPAEEPEPEEQIDDDENDPQRLNRGEGRRKRVTQCEFYSFLMSILDYFNNVLVGGPLNQQWMVDSYVKIEANRVKYIREHQVEFHVAQYNGLLDYTNNRAERKNMTVGSYHVLPSSFIGSPRAMKQAYQDAMVICGKFGKPVNDIEKRQVLGFATARIHVIEFQTYGLPNCHMLIWIDKRDAPATAKDVDETICAEIPDKTTHPRLYNIVMAHMFHGPCGSTNKQSPCTDGNICRKRDVPTVEWDEIASHLDARYVSAPEACWRIFKLPLSDRSHAICRQVVHLPREQSGFFLPGNKQQAAINTATKENDHGRGRRFPNASSTEATLCRHLPLICRRTRIIGCLYTVGVRHVERHCLRSLLINVKGATSFEHLRTVDGLQHATFKSAAITLNLLEDDRAWSTTMEEAAVFQMPAQLRQLYVDICLYCKPTDAATLFDANLNHLMEDFIRSGHDANVAKNLTLKWIQDKLRLNNKTMEEFSLPAPDFHLINQLIEAQMEENDDNVRQQKRLMGEMMLAQLSDGQRAAFDQIMAAVNDATNTTHPRQYFLDGPGGTGKTFVYNTVINVLQGQGKGKRCTFLGEH
ncbi:Uncharacterized protein APZ42_024749 [Daphnia magna]|uniref:ATP-dependent DNA helicase n=1 Tax=Daphnia magna TaxID=35525 RepID=A0A164TTD5_9CRUS|nr:Uncharacterized protein APZ42_024749 [Daphnia magna]